jgi:hypothetical protein
MNLQPVGLTTPRLFLAVSPTAKLDNNCTVSSVRNPMISLPVR